ncbi:Hpt domain-containing protein [Vibrio sp. RE86]|uniref:Hpt domain-containing protein n=1 Tax=Vibrio sp. RE86 TaxID=2607605 RepID=UPI00149364BE|nr:Hpt domain-containing protein [Vibrio sp. RE86]NOH79308.1 Hpt domain-containing protein [Vibrio sp. RE86]
MDRKTLKLGWLLLVLWSVCIAVIASSYRSTSATKEQIYELGSSIQELRESFSFDVPYRVQMADSQALNLQLIYALRLQLDAHYQRSWFLPDINQLLFTTDRFIEQTQLYLDNTLDLVALAEQIRVMRERNEENTDVHQLYLRLGANVLDAIFSNNESSPEIYRDLDRIYAISNQLPVRERQDLQQVLATVSSVLGGYAQGTYIVDKLISHNVHAQISLQRSEFNGLLLKHIWVGALISLLVVLGYLWLLKTSSPEVRTKQDPLVEQDIKPQPPQSNVSPLPTQDTTELAQEKPTDTREPEINFAKMLDSLNQDKESVCMLLEVFIEDHSQDTESITRLLTDAPEEAQRKAHSLKGVGGNLGADKLREAASKVEQAIKDDITLVPALLDELNLRLERAIDEARLFLKENTAIEN